MKNIVYIIFIVLGLSLYGQDRITIDYWIRENESPQKFLYEYSVNKISFNDSSCLESLIEILDTLSLNKVPQMYVFVLYTKNDTLHANIQNWEFRDFSTEQDRKNLIGSYLTNNKSFFLFSDSESQSQDFITKNIILSKDSVHINSNIIVTPATREKFYYVIDDRTTILDAVYESSKFKVIKFLSNGKLRKFRL